MRIVVSIGGNALSKPDQKGTFEEQIANVKVACKQIFELWRNGHQLVITHGNGPQVGNLAIQQEIAADSIPVQPLHVVGAMTQGQIGYMIQQTLHNMLSIEKYKAMVVTLITRALIRSGDPSFSNPTKPIGPFYNKSAAELLGSQRKYVIKKVMTSGRLPYRRLVASPEPISIIEADVIRELVNLGAIVIACGGGGIPVISNDRGEYEGVNAVVDKDLASEIIARSVGAQVLLILTNVDKVKLNFGKKDEKSIDVLTVSQARQYIEEGHFLEGSMKPKILASVKFVENGGEKAIICALEDAVQTLEGRAGTQIVKG